MRAEGSIVARVYTSSAYLPLRNAPVIFTQSAPDGMKKLLAIRMTDESGLTEPVYIATPQVDQSLIPDPPNLPYTTIQVQAEYPGYNRLTVQNVQIFPGIVTVQKMRLRPLSASESATHEQITYAPDIQSL